MIKRGPRVARPAQNQILGTDAGPDRSCPIMLLASSDVTRSSKSAFSVQCLPGLFSSHPPFAPIFISIYPGPTTPFFPPPPFFLSSVPLLISLTYHPKQLSLSVPDSIGLACSFPASHPYAFSAIGPTPPADALRIIHHGYSRESHTEPHHLHRFRGLVSPVYPLLTVLTCLNLRGHTCTPSASTPLARLVVTVSFADIIVPAILPSS